MDVAAAADMEAPFLWLRFAVAVAVAVPFAGIPLLLFPLSGFRDVRDLGLEAAAAASAKVANAGVEGLLALPLLVFTVPSNGVGGAIGVAGSRFGSRSSAGLIVLLSFLLLLPFGAGGSGGGGSTGSASDLACSGLEGATAGFSFWTFDSVVVFDPLLCAMGSGVLGSTPFSLFEAAEGGR
jgi:hypothetical protein